MVKSIENHQNDRYRNTPELKVFMLSNQKGLQNFQLSTHSTPPLETVRQAL